MRIIRLTVGVAKDSLETVGLEAVEIPEGAALQPFKARRRAQVGKQSVEAEAGADLPGAPARLRIDRDVEVDEAHEVGGDSQERLALGEGFADETEFEGLEIAQAAVDQLA